MALSSPEAVSATAPACPWSPPSAS
jgi:hypothetical protein